MKLLISDIVKLNPIGIILYFRSTIKSLVMNIYQDAKVVVICLLKTGFKILWICQVRFVYFRDRNKIEKICIEAHFLEKGRFAVVEKNINKVMTYLILINAKV